MSSVEELRKEPLTIIDENHEDVADVLPWYWQTGDNASYLRTLLFNAIRHDGVGG